MTDDALVPAIDHYPNGNVRFAGHNLGGAMHGDWQFFRADGSLMRSGRFERGEQVGRWRTFDRQGRLVKETDFGEGGGAAS
jgi:antitoxin component YwqK of YwqJK toxin-antitoxin module